jgi:hypothetical protein
MNAFEMILVLSMVMTGFLFARFLGVFWSSRIFEFIGFALGCSLPVLILWFVNKVATKWHEFHPLRPPCRKNGCSSTDYELIECLRTGSSVYRCKCGKKYLQDEKSFAELLEDGTVHPYMRKNGLFGRWERVK